MEATTANEVGHAGKDSEMSVNNQEETLVSYMAANGNDTTAVAPEAESGGVEQTEKTQTAASTAAAGSAGATGQQDNQGENGNPSPTDDAQADPSAEPKLSKNQLRKLKRKAAWEDGREDRKRKRKEKRHDRQAARREEIAAAIAEAEAQGLDPCKAVIPPKKKTSKPPSTQVPVSLILDCDFETYMLEKERVSLASQITRCYSDNRAAKYRAHLYVSSYGGHLKERFETTLGNQHLHWKGVRLIPGNFIEAARDADELMKGPRGGVVIDLLKPTEQDGASRKPAVVRDVYDSAPATAPEAEPEPADELRNIVYLSSDSVNTLARLEPGTSYVIGGLVDRNREKGLCHRRARELGVRTAKLPIGEYMNLSSRRVLATNHVVEIMLKWLETGSWAEAFLSVIPKRKEAKLKEEVGEGSASGTPAGDEEIEDSRFEENDTEDIDAKQSTTETAAATQSEKTAQEDGAREAVSAS